MVATQFSASILICPLIMIYNWFGLNLSLSMSQITANLRFSVGGRGKDHSLIPAQASQGARGGPRGCLKQGWSKELFLIPTSTLEKAFFKHFCRLIQAEWICDLIREERLQTDLNILKNVSSPLELKR